MPRRPGNPNRKWSSGGKYEDPIRPAQFEEVVKQLGLRSTEYVTSKQLHAWVKKNYTCRYVPEALLEAFGLRCEE